MVEYVLADAAVGWLLPAIGIFVLLLYFVVAAGEALVMKIMDWGPYKRCFTDALLINLISTIPGFIIAEYFPTMEFVGLIAAFLLSVLIEGGVLALLRRHPVSRSLQVSLAANLASYLLFALWYFAD